MKVAVFLVTCFLFVGAIHASADDAKDPEIKKRDSAVISELPSSSSSSEDGSGPPEAQRKRDSGYYYVKPYRYLSYYGSGRHRYRGRITKRPFKEYGPPPPSSQESSSFSQESSHFSSSSGNNIVNQETPVPGRYPSFAEENPIASQNSQPFGQDTANYLPPKNQKLPEYSEPHIFSNQHHDFPQQQQQHQEFLQQQFQQHQSFSPEQFQQHPDSSQQQYFQEQHQQQQQQYFQEQHQQQQFENQNFLSQNQNFGQTEFQNQQQISDAANFLSQNAQAISNLYNAPAPNQNYGPANQPTENVDHQHLHPTGGQFETSNQQNNLNLQVSTGSNGFQAPLPSYASGVLNNNRDTVHIQLSNQEKANNLAISQQGFYQPSTSTTPAPLTFQTGHSESSQSLTAAHSLRPAVIHPGFPQYGGFVPSFVSSSSFVPTTLFPKPIPDTPTHFAIPIPAFDVPHRPPSSPTRPLSDTPTISIPLGPVNTLLPPVVKPNPVPVIPADTPVHHPSYGLVNPSVVYKPVKVYPYPVYYYPSVTYPVRKLLGAAAAVQPWSYAPSFSQRRYAKEA